MRPLALSGWSGNSLDHASSRSTSRCRFRVAPSPASSASACNAFRGCPVPRIHWLRRRPCIRVTPECGPRVVAGDGSSRRLDFHILERCVQVKLRLPGSSRCLPRLRRRIQVAPRSASSGFTGDGPSMRLEARILRRCRVPFPGCPVPRCFGIADDQLPGLPGTCIFRHQLITLPSCPGCVHPPVAPERIFGSPRFFFGLWLRRPTWFHFALALRSFGGTDGLLSDSPRIARPQLAASAPPGLPGFTWTAGSMMNPNCSRTLHPRLAPRMNLRVQAGFADLPEARRFLNFSRVLAIGCPTTNSRCPSILRRCPTRATLQLATGSPTEETLGWFDLWKQV